MSQKAKFDLAVGNRSESLSHQAFEQNRGAIRSLSLEIGGQNLVKQPVFAPEVRI